MNYRLVLKYLGVFSAAMSVLFAPSMLWTLYYGEWNVLGTFLESGAICILLGAVMYLLGRGASPQLNEREALAMVGLGWLLLPALGGLPFWIGGHMTVVDAFFESMSGFATCGASILRDIEVLPKGLLFWRSFTIWLGGMGIVLLFLAVLPYLGAGGKVLAKSESSGHNAKGFSPRIRDTAKILYRVYFGITIVLTLLLYLAGMSLFDALCHTFATLGTGGYSTYNASVAHFDSVTIELIIIAGMLISGTSFALLFATARGDWRFLFTNTEWRVYMGLFLASTAIITLNLIGVKGNIPEAFNPDEPVYSWGHALRVASFQVASCQTCTGFITDNFDNWPQLSKFILVLLMLVGGCAGSTSGGMKVIRFIILSKMTYWSVEHTFRPKTVRPVRVGGIVISDEIQRAVYAFFVLQIFIIAIGTLLLCAVGLPVLSSVTAVITAQSGVGPGLELVGAIMNFAFIPDFGKIVLVLIMAIGRVELFCICAMFIPSFWKHS